MIVRLNEQRLVEEKRFYDELWNPTTENCYVVSIVKTPSGYRTTVSDWRDGHTGSNSWTPKPEKHTYSAKSVEELKKKFSRFPELLDLLRDGWESEVEDLEEATNDKFYVVMYDPEEGYRVLDRDDAPDFIEEYGPDAIGTAVRASSIDEARNSIRSMLKRAGLEYMTDNAIIYRRPVESKEEADSVLEGGSFIKL